MKTQPTIVTVLFLFTSLFTVQSKLNKHNNVVKTLTFDKRQNHCSASNSTAFGQVLSEEEMTQSGVMSINIKLIARDTTYIDSIQIEAPQIFSFSINNVVSNHFSSAGNYNLAYLLPDEFSSCIIDVSYNSSNLPYYSKEIKFKTYTHNNLGEVGLSIADAIIYYTPYGTTEIWDKKDFDQLPRVWMAEKTPEPERVSIERANIPTSTKPNEESITENWQHKYQMRFINGLPYAIQMAAVHPDTIIARRYRDSIEAFSEGQSLFEDHHFHGHVTGKIRGNFTNDIGVPANMDLRGIKVVIYDNDVTYNDEFADGYTDANGNFDIWYDRYQSFLEGDEIEMIVTIYSENVNNHIYVMEPYLYDDPYEVANWIGDVGEGDQTTDIGIWQLSDAVKDPFKLLHWANCGVQFVNENVGYYGRADLYIEPYSDLLTSHFSIFPYQNISLETNDVTHETIIWHELGHYIMQNFCGISPFAIGDHSSQTESSNCMQAWSEGWATGFMGMLDQYYRDMDGEYGLYAFYENPGANNYNLEFRRRTRLNQGHPSNGIRSEFHISCAIYDLFDGAGKFASGEPQISFMDFSNNDPNPLKNSGYDAPFDDDLEMSAYQIFKPLIDAKNGSYGIYTVTSYYQLLNLKSDCDMRPKIQKVFTQNGILENTDNQQSLTNILSSDNIGTPITITEWALTIPLYTFYISDVNLISSTSTITRYNFAASQSDETNFISDPLTINNGGKLGINANISGTSSPLNGSNMSVSLCNQTVTVGSTGLIEIGNTSAYGKLIVSDNAILRIQDGGQLNINKNSRVVLQNGGKLIFESNANINIQDYESMIEIKKGGIIEVGPNATFKWTGDGYLKVTADPAHLGTSNILATSNNSNAKVEIRAQYPGNAQKVIEVTSGSLSIDKSISDVRIISGRIIIGQYSILDVEPPLYMADLLITSNSPTVKHGGVWVYGQQNTAYINKCIFENADAGIRVFGAKGISNIAKFMNSKFINCTTGILVYGKGAEVKDCIFDGNGQGVAISLNSIENTCQIENTQIYNCVRGIDAVGSFSNTIIVKNCLIPGNSTTGVFTQNVALAPGCNTIINNYSSTNQPVAIGNNINLSNNSYLAMEPAVYPGTGNNNLSSSQGKCIETNSANFLYMDIANSDLNSSTSFSLAGTLRPRSNQFPKYPNIRATYNYWWTPYSSPNNGSDYLIQYLYGAGGFKNVTVDGSPMLASSPVYVGCGSLGNGTGNGNNNDPDDPSVFYLKPSKTLSSEIEIKAAFKAGMSLMYSSTSDYVTAMGYFNQILSENYSTERNIVDQEGDTISEFGLWYDVIDLSYIKMLECLSQGITSGQIVIDENEIPTEVQSVLDAQSNILNLLGEGEDIIELRFKIYTDQAMIYRLINRRLQAYIILTGLSSWSVSESSMKQLQYYLCVVDKEINMLNGSLSKYGYDSINNCSALLELPDNGAPDQLYDVPDLDPNINIFGKRNLSAGLLSQNVKQQIEQIELYPNPSQNLVNIKLASHIIATQIDLLDIAGRIVSSEKINNSSELIVLHIDVENGTYFIQVTTNTNIIRKKIVIVK